MDLLVTLGHNCSAILVQNGNVIAGYEEERFTRNKKTSSFPIQSIEKLLNLVDNINIMYVSHWFDNYDFHLNKIDKISKYWNYNYIEKLKEKYNFEIKTLNDNFTHHTAHAYSSMAFYNNFKNIDNFDGHVIVADGFGNRQEVFSIFRLKNGILTLISNTTEYSNSLGLMYQYATSFCGMKEKQDEYKFLGYESEINNLNINLQDINTDNIVYSLFNIIIGNKTNNKYYNEYINLEELNNVKNNWNLIFENVLKNVKYDSENDSDNFNKRVIIGYFVQKIIEDVNKKVIEYYNIKRILLSGGIYYNVKLNMSISTLVDEISVIPVAGDQGAAIGLYYYDNKKFNFKNLCFGKRELINKIESNYNKNIEYFYNKKDLINRTVDLLNINHIPQIVLGNMEFGPRALCHTSTLALPTKDNSNFINRANNRNEIMPMAPVILDKNVKKLFKSEQYDKIVGSLGYMIITLDYLDNVDYNKYNGVMHKYPGSNLVYSGRPQVVYDKNSTIYQILDKIESFAIINTSYNIHGKPIVFNIDDAINDFRYQTEHSDDADRLHLLIGIYDEDN